MLNIAVKNIVQAVQSISFSYLNFKKCEMFLLTELLLKLL